MKAFLLRLLERVANAFREADYAAGREEYMRTYGATYALERIRVKQEAAERARTILPIGSDEAMSLRAGQAFMSHTGSATALVWARSGVGSERLAYAVYGGTLENANARAAQLVSALDGARRL